MLKKSALPVWQEVSCLLFTSGYFQAQESLIWSKSRAATSGTPGRNLFRSMYSATWRGTSANTSWKENIFEYAQSKSMENFLYVHCTCYLVIMLRRPAYTLNCGLSFFDNGKFENNKYIHWIIIVICINIITVDHSELSRQLVC